MTDLVTERLVLHPISVDDAEQMMSGGPDADASWEPGFPTEDDVSVAKRYLARCSTTGDPRPFGPYAIRRRSDHRVIGGVDFHSPPDEHGHVTIGYGVVPSVRGKGYASEALRALLSFARANGVASVKGDADHDNVASQHVMAAAGMLPVGEDERVRYFAVSWAGEGRGPGGDPEGGSAPPATGAPGGPSASIRAAEGCRTANSSHMARTPVIAASTPRPSTARPSGSTSR